MQNILKDYLAIAKELKEKGLLDVNDDKLMDEIYDGIANIYVAIFGEKCRTEITLLIQKAFETELQ